VAHHLQKCVYWKRMANYNVWDCIENLLILDCIVDYLQTSQDEGATWYDWNAKGCQSCCLWWSKNSYHDLVILHTVLPNLSLLVSQLQNLPMIICVASDWGGSISRWSWSVSWNYGQVVFRTSKRSSHRLKDKSSNFKNITGNDYIIADQCSMSFRCYYCVHIGHIFF